ncbi:tetratricopeptide repeat protein [Sorangium sp. So ce1097]|uniref:tetratricopeptide repeat protein n=1 Tax=Sorangium sp. So ce1097 TaxID=3133330 RepID=UPI003F635BEC
MPIKAPDIVLFSIPAAEDPSADLLRCERGDMEGCRAAGWLFLHGFGLAEDAPRADDLYTKACKGKNIRACMELAVEYYHLHDWPIKATEELAEAVHHKMACDHGDQQGCLALALDVLRHPEELSVFQDTVGKTAQKTAEDACAASQVAACSTLMGLARQSGDMSRAETLATKLLAMCRAGEMGACASVLRYPWSDRTPAERKSLTRDLGLKLCKLSQAECRAGREACSLAIGCVEKDGFDPQGPEAVAEFTYRACAVSRDFKRCEELADMFERGKGVPKDPEKASFFDMAACQHGRDLACRRTLGRIRKQGSGPEVDKKIFEVTKIGCRVDKRDVGWLMSCERLAEMYETGRGTQKDVEKAVEIFTAVCPYREESCDNLRRLKRPVPPDADGP